MSTHDTASETTDKQKDKGNDPALSSINALCTDQADTDQADTAQPSEAASPERKHPFLKSVQAASRKAGKGIKTAQKKILPKDVLCPYCLQQLRKRDLKLTCPLCGTETAPSPFEFLLGRLPRCSKPGCNGFASDRWCGYCNHKLPSDILDYEKYLRFSILGTTGSGKTCFLTAMLHELRDTQGSPWVISHMDDQQTLAIFQENNRMIFEMGQPVGATPAGVTPPPQLWRIKDKSRMTNTTIPSYSMTIFDGAGEDCTHIDPVISRYIGGSKALVILIDPLALPGVAKTVPSDILNWSTTASHNADASANMVDDLANYIRSTCRINPNTLIDRDVAIVFTKIDAVRDDFANATVMRPSPHLAQKGFVQADADKVHKEIRNWLEKRGETTFLNAIETNFRGDQVRFFGISSFGHPPTDSGHLDTITPHRVLDPLIWMLAKEEIVPIL